MFSPEKEKDVPDAEQRYIQLMLFFILSAVMTLGIIVHLVFFANRVSAIDIAILIFPIFNMFVSYKLAKEDRKEIKQK